MSNENKNSLSYKLQKNPALIGIFLVVVIVAVVCVAGLSKAMKTRVAQIQNTTAPVTTTKPVVTQAVPDYTVKLDNIKKYYEKIENVSAHYENTRVVLTIEFKDKQALIDAHLAENEFSIDAKPSFVFYIGSATYVKCPATFKLASDSKTVSYYLSDIDDLKNVVALEKNLTVSFNNVLSDLQFNLALEFAADSDNAIKTLIGTYGMSVESYNSQYAKSPVDLSKMADGIKNADLTVSDTFVWLDIYFENEESFKSLNHNFANNFVSFGFEVGGKKFERKFAVTQYDGLYMLRCKFDSYALKEFLNESGESLTMSELFDRNIRIWTTDYETETALFEIN